MINQNLRRTSLRFLRLVDPDPDCLTCLGTGLDEMLGPHTGLPYVVECPCRITYVDDPYQPTGDAS